MSALRLRLLGVRIGDGGVPVRMRVGFFAVLFRFVDVLAVLIVPVRMVVAYDFVCMRMLAPLANKKPKSERHQGRGHRSFVTTHFFRSSRRRTLFGTRVSR